MQAADAFLTSLGIPFQRFDHVAVFTCEEAEKLPPMPGAHTKNLFLTDKKGERFWLVAVGYEKRADLKGLGALLGVSGLRFGSPEKLKERLGVDPGSETLLGVMNDADHQVDVILDADLWKADAFQCHPLVNTATLSIPRDGLERFFAATGHTPRIIEVPERTM